MLPRFAPKRGHATPGAYKVILDLLDMDDVIKAPMMIIVWSNPTSRYDGTSVGSWLRKGRNTGTCYNG
jgi:hypothetical protein